MKNKSWLFGLIVFAIIIGLAIWGISKTNNKQVSGEATTNTAEEPTTGVITGQEAYFDNNATVMEFYQPSCGWCVKESEVLNKLAQKGYRVKPMNAAADPSLWTKYNVKGTPTFIAANGDRLEGYQTEDQLKSFLDAHK